jgi:hypothetical protein
VSGEPMTEEMATGLDELSASNKIVKFLVRAMRDGSGMSVETAAKELIEDLGLPADQVHAAVEMVRALARDIQTAQEPRGVVAGNIESWYLGPRSEDRNWPTLVEILREEGWTDDALDDLDQSSTKVVAQLPSPNGTGSYDCRGLVLGYVQSGKTTNFTAVIAKAADAGYRFFLVLGGVHNALRQQTQDRLNQQLWERHPDLWYRLTDEDDFKFEPNVDAHLSPTNNKRVLAIVKKNGPRLRALRKWLIGARSENLEACPMLIIDDEADQATPNTAKPDRNPTAMNRLIRQLVNDVPKTAYVGYTATPFANVLIDPNDATDLYPRDFIVDLPRPNTYIGPEAIFGREALEFDPDGTDIDDGGDFVREVPSDELDDLRPKGAKGRHDFYPSITESLDAALRYFLLSTAARRARGKGNRHATALVHTSQHVDVHRKTAAIIKSHVKALGRRLAERDGALLLELEETWRREEDLVPAQDWDVDPVDWADIAALLPTVAQDVEIITDNSQSDERLNFDDRTPRVIIAVGGNTLSRGLTLEGLAVSFFVRTASAYDTLLQMGRWFGYRHGYADLTRIWMTAEMHAWFHHLATVEQEVRFDIERYAQGHEKPSDFGPRIRTHPKLAITAASKMQHARKAQQSYSGRRIQTILFNHADGDWLRANIDAARNLAVAAASAECVEARPGIQILGPLPSVEMRSFLDGYRFHEESRDLDSELIWKYIEGRLNHGELTHFRIAVMGRATCSSELGAVDLGLDQQVNCINRSRMRIVGGASYADIKALMSRPDRAVDLGLAPNQVPTEAGDLAKVRNLPANGGRGDGSGLLLLYPVSKDSVPSRVGDDAKRKSSVREPLQAAEHVIGVGLVFPESRDTGAKVDYVTADIRDLGVDEPDAPDESDEPPEEPDVIAT